MSELLHGWHPDPFGRHEFRYFCAGAAIDLVRDGKIETSDPIDASAWHLALAGEAATAVSRSAAAVPQRPGATVLRPQRARKGGSHRLDVRARRPARARNLLGEPRRNSRSAPSTAPRHAPRNVLDALRGWRGVAVAALVLGLIGVADLSLYDSRTPTASVAANSNNANKAVSSKNFADTTVSESEIAAEQTQPSATPAATASGSTAPPANAALVSRLAANGIPETAMAAYKQAAAQYNAVAPACKISWPLLAAIGRVESNHGQFAGAVLHQDGASTPHIIGIALNGHGTALIPATPLGIVLDGDHVYDHALGPMQFIPSTWMSFQLPGAGHANADPFNIFDAAATAARYLCVAGGDLTSLQGQQRAILAYNHSSEYVMTVLNLETAYAAGAGITVPKTPATPAVLPTVPNVAPADPGTPPVLTSTAPATASASSPTSSTNSPSPPSPSSSPSTTTSDVPTTVPTDPTPTDSESAAPTSGGSSDAPSTDPTTAPASPNTSPDTPTTTG